MGNFAPILGTFAQVVDARRKAPSRAQDVRIAAPIFLGKIEPADSYHPAPCVKLWPCTRDLDRFAAVKASKGIPLFNERLMFKEPEE